MGLVNAWPDDFVSNIKLIVFLQNYYEANYELANRPVINRLNKDFYAQNTSAFPDTDPKESVLFLLSLDTNGTAGPEVGFLNILRQFVDRGSLFWDQSCVGSSVPRLSNY